MNLGSFYDKQTIEKGLYAERMWIPFTLLNVEKVREALNAGKSFIDKTVYNVVPQLPRLSRFLYKRYPSLCNQAFMNNLKFGYGNNNVNVVYYDTGAEIFEYLKDVKYYFFFGDRYESFVHEKHVRHYEGVTRKLLQQENDKTAFDVNSVKEFLINRLKTEYNFNYKE